MKTVEIKFDINEDVTIKGTGAFRTVRSVSISSDGVRYYLSDSCAYKESQLKKAPKDIYIAMNESHGILSSLDVMIYDSSLERAKERAKLLSCTTKARIAKLVFMDE